MSQFQSTHWSLIAAAAGRAGWERGADHAPPKHDVEAVRAREALEALCRVYWRPLFAFAQRAVGSPQDAEDRTQEFFCELLDGRLLAAADPGRGRFRAFLLTAFRRFLADARERAGAAKRGGNVRILSLDFASAGTGPFDPADRRTPDVVFEQEWALALLAEVLRRLESEQRAAGHGERFEALRPFLSGEDADEGYDRCAESLGLNPSAVRMAVSRLRRRYRELLRATVSETVAEPSEVEDELRHLMTVFGRA